MLAAFEALILRDTGCRDGLLKVTDNDDDSRLCVQLFTNPSVVGYLTSFAGDARIFFMSTASDWTAGYEGGRFRCSSSVWLFLAIGEICDVASKLGHSLCSADESNAAATVGDTHDERESCDGDVLTSGMVDGSTFTSCSSSESAFSVCSLEANDKDDSTASDLVIL